MKIYLERFDKKLAGVCGGLAQYFKIDSSIIRLLFILSTCMLFGLPIVVYLACWIVFPKGPRYYVEARYKKLYRSRHDRKIFGICGGLSKYFSINPQILRVVFIVAMFVTGLVPVIVAYIVASLIIPEEPVR